MDKIDYRAVTKYYFLKGNTRTQIKDELDSVYGDSAPSFTTVKFWAAAQFRCNKSEFWHRLITTDETWIHPFTPETKIKSKQRITKGEPAPKKSKIVFSAGKVMATFFWDSYGVISIDYLRKGKTITGAYYASLLDKLKAELAGKLPHLQKKKILFHQDNAPSHTSAVAMAKIHELWIELLDHAANGLLTRSSPKQFLFVHSSKNCARRTEIFVK
ncbi:histone-lysine N-methyltransferase SETMAR [Trichonephila clavipes]|nr:histone-lysine N-methyltransferase SETMAR [Trichonephila clavipes]